MVQDSLNGRFDECPTSAGWIQHSLAQGGVNHGLGDFLRQPAGCVVLAELFALFLGDHVLVERGRHLGCVLRPVELFDDACDFTEVRAFTYFRGPGKEVGVDDTVQVRLFGQDLSLEESVRPLSSVAGYGADKSLLHDDGDQAGDVGVPDE